MMLQLLGVTNVAETPRPRPKHASFRHRNKCTVNEIAKAVEISRSDEVWCHKYSKLLESICLTNFPELETWNLELGTRNANVDRGELFTIKLQLTITIFAEIKSELKYRIFLRAASLNIKNLSKYLTNAECSDLSYMATSRAWRASRDFPAQTPPY